MRRLLHILRNGHPSNGTDREVARHNAIMQRADRLLRAAVEYAEAEKARRRE